MMKKLLLTTALVSMSATAAFADGYTPTAKDFDVKVGGDLDFQACFRSQKKEYTTRGGDKLGITQNNDGVGFDTAADLYLDARNTTAQGMTYGAHIGALTTTSSLLRDGQKHVNKSYLFMEHKDMGRLEAGSADSAADAMTVGASNVAVATGGVSGDWWKYVVLVNDSAPMADATQFILNPAMPVDNALTDVSTKFLTSDQSRKVTYYTPKFNGFQAGVSYMPDASNTGGSIALPSTDVYSGGLENAFSVGTTWEGKMQKDHGFKVALTADHGKPKYPTSFATAKLEDTKAYNAGVVYTYQDMMSVAVGYTDYNKTGMYKTASTATEQVKKSNALTGGVSVAMDKFNVSLTGMVSEKNKNKTTVYSLGAEYKMAPGLRPYAEITSFDMKQKRSQHTTTGDVTKLPTELKNKGTAFILGTKVKF